MATRLLPADEKQRLIANIVGSLKQAPVRIQKKQIERFYIPVQSAAPLTRPWPIPLTGKALPAQATAVQAAAKR